MRARVSQLDDGELRALSLATAYEEAAADLLRDKEPRGRALLLLQVSVTQAILSGDRALLTAAIEVIERLNEYTPEDLPGCSRWRVSLEMLLCTAVLALEGLRHEYEHAAQEA